MKHILNCLLAFIALPMTLFAQNMTISNCKVMLNGQVHLVLYNAGLNNNGSITGNGIVQFAGSQAAVITGTNVVRFNKLVVNKSQGGFVSLQNDVAIKDTIVMSSGNLLLNGRTLNLGSSGIIKGERNQSYITGTAGGRILLTTNIKTAVNAFNPGRIGIEFTSASPIGNLTIERTHTPQLLPDGFESISRSFFINGSNYGLNASVRFFYLDEELGGANETSLVLWRDSDVSNSWTPAGNDGNDTALNWVMKDQLDHITRFTLAGSGSSMFQPDPLKALRITGKPAVKPSLVYALQAYPNPTSGKFVLIVQSKIKQNIVLNLSSETGRLLLKRTIHAEAGMNVIPWNLHGYAAGVYLVWDNAGMIKIRIVKQ
ncbi:MAG: T9SS type A sorting domain-containing protein [Chitinophagaceae bacterium]